MPNRSDNFTRADSTTTMNPPSDGGSNWVAPAGTTWGITGNAGFLAVSAPQAVIVLESSLSNVDIQVTMKLVGSDGGLVARLSDDNNYFVLKIATGALTLFKKVAGTFSLVQDAGPITINPGDVVKLSCDSNNLFTAFLNGVLKISVTDASLSSNTQHGLRDNSDTNNRFTTFSITSNSATGSTVVSYNGLSVADGLTYHRGIDRPHIVLTPAGGGSFTVVKDSTITDMKSSDLNKETYIIDGALP